uniref:Sex-regulated protein janus-B n=1 Tax=Acrobeloides nanus TaxID=290746 RepID=A0A914E2L7_9BILA
MANLSSVADVVIDPSGTFKYILIQATDPASKNSKLIVRGFASCGYHADILDQVKSVESRDVKFKCLGGGRIKHEPASKSLFVYGYSQGFGQADHQKSVDILKTKYPDYSISFSNEGY